MSSYFGSWAMDDYKWVTKMYCSLKEIKMHRAAHRLNVISSKHLSNRSVLKDAIKSVVMNIKPSTRDEVLKQKNSSQHKPKLSFSFRVYFCVGFSSCCKLRKRHNSTILLWVNARNCVFFSCPFVEVIHFILNWNFMTCDHKGTHIDARSV